MPKITMLPAAGSCAPRPPH